MKPETLNAVAIAIRDTFHSQGLAPNRMAHAAIDAYQASDEYKALVADAESHRERMSLMRMRDAERMAFDDIGD